MVIKTLYWSYLPAECENWSIQVSLCWGKKGKQLLWSESGCNREVTSQSRACEWKFRLERKSLVKERDEPELVLY